MNKAVLLGRLTRDGDLRYSTGENAMAVLKNTIAVDRKVKKDANVSTDFISIIAFGKTAENIDKYFHKGSKIAIIGHIQTGSYTNKDGVKVYTTDIVVDEFDFVESKTHTQASVNDSFMDVGDEALPFN